MANSFLDNIEDLMYESDKSMLSTTITPQMLDKLSHRQLETVSASQTANQLLSGLLPDVSDFMTNIAIQETGLGKGKSEVSYSPFQIDPIRYQDVQERGRTGDAGERTSFVNEFLRNQGYGEDFDILNLPFDEIREPLIGALITRLSLGNIEEEIPKDLEGQADYWKRNWNSLSERAMGEIKHFKKNVKDWNSILGIKTYDNTVLK